MAKGTGVPTSVILQEAKDTPVQITPAVLSSEQNVANAFSSAGLIPSRINIKNFAVTTFNSILGGSS